MVKLFAQKTDFTTPNTVTRDMNTLQDAANAFMKDPKVLPQNTNLFVQTIGADQWIFLSLDYNIKTN